GQVPPWLYRAAEAATVLGLMSDAARARDCSWLTQGAIRALADRLIRQGAVSGQGELVEAGLAGLEALGQRVSWLNLYGLDRALPRAAEHGVFAALPPRNAGTPPRVRP